MLVMCWEEVSYVILLFNKNFTNQSFWKKIFLLRENYGYIISFIKFNCLIEPNLLQIVFDLITCSIVALYVL